MRLSGISGCFRRGNQKELATTRAPLSPLAGLFYCPGRASQSQNGQDVPQARCTEKSINLRRCHPIAPTVQEPDEVHFQDPATAQWVSISTNALSSDSLYVSDPTWTSFSRRFYRHLLAVARRPDFESRRNAIWIMRTQRQRSDTRTSWLKHLHLGKTTACRIHPSFSA